MATNKSVDEIAAEIEGLSREALLVRMAKMGDLLEELEDVADLLRSARASRRGPTRSSRTSSGRKAVKYSIEIKRTAEKRHQTTSDGKQFSLAGTPSR
ncbi:MAG: hypothetical protein Q7R81_04465 [Candidatus Peregrinibacteria bacterium]|nr:hypothetical protein [Candidatus Peregrinibacteria bacterium]